MKLFLVVFITLASANVANAADTSYSASVRKVVDGDTFSAMVEVWPGIFIQTDIRLIGVNAPEIKTGCTTGREAALRAKDRLRELIGGRKVELSGVKRDKYAGRVDAVVKVAKLDIAQILLDEGLAVEYGQDRDWCVAPKAFGAPQ